MIGRLLIAGLGAAVGLALLGWALSFTMASKPAKVSEAAIPAREIQEPGLSCSSAENEIRTAIADARACSIDSECVSFDPGCPFGCLQAVNRQHKASLLDRIDAHHKSACPICMYKCQNPVGRPSCHRGQCRIARTPQKPVGESFVDG